MSAELKPQSLGILWTFGSFIFCRCNSTAEPRLAGCQAKGVDVKRSLIDVYMNTLTLVTTYKCTAACEQCCFGCTPESEGRLSLAAMKGAISEAKHDFPRLQLVAFTGGECFLLKQDLFAAIEHATSLGLATRCVSNGSWGKSLRAAAATARRCRQAGLSELNISTGLDHAKFVPIESVINAASAALAQNIRVAVTIEQDDEASSFASQLLDDRMQALIRSHPTRLHIMVNSWMPFTLDEKRRKKSSQTAEGPCPQLFGNIVVTPFKQIAACCGLTYEHIPEMILGTLGEGSLRQAADAQLDDLVKVWLHVEGPAGIARALLPSQEAKALIDRCDHICELCARVHQHQTIRDTPLERWAGHATRLLQAMHVASAGRAAAVTLDGGEPCRDLAVAEADGN